MIEQTLHCGDHASVHLFDHRLGRPRVRLAAPGIDGLTDELPDANRKGR